MPINFSIDDFRPGDKVSVRGEIKVVLAKFGEKYILCTDGEIVQIGLIKDIYHVNLDTNWLEIDIIALYHKLRQAGLVAPKIVELSVGDLVLVLPGGNTAKVCTVAMIDRPNGFVYDQLGDFLPWGRGEMALTGWRTEAKDLLTEEGRKVMHQMYE